MIIIHPSGDLVIKVVEFDESVVVICGQDKPVLEEREFQLSKQIYKNSRTLGRLLALHLNSEHAVDPFTLKDDSVTSMEIWFKTMHEGPRADSGNASLNEPWSLAVSGSNTQVVTKY